MGAQKSIHAGKGVFDKSVVPLRLSGFTAKIDVNVDFTHKLCASLMLPTLRSSGSPFSLVIGSLCIKHPNLFGGSEKLDVSWDKGLYDSNVLVAYRRPRPEWLAQQSFVLQHSLSPEIGIHGIPVNNFSRSGSGGINLSRLSVGMDLKEPASSKWSSTTSIKFEHVRPLNDDGRAISRDYDGFPLTSSGNPHDSMVVLKQESQFAKANDNSFFHFNLQIEQGVPVLSKWIIFNRFKFVASKGIKLGPAFLLTRLTGGSIVGDMAPYQAFSIGGLGSVRGYGEGAVGSGRSCLVANSELTLPLNKMLEGAIFLDCGTDLRSGHLVPGGVTNIILLKLLANLHFCGNPALRQGKPGSGVGMGYGLRFKSQFGHFQVDYAVNAFQQRTLYFGLSNLPS
ncbi:Outer envelope protein [Vigna angularis]|uniref:Outer envelope protein n=1 Tax=Phaseolus angularis TaxID=3914 RepID=A0A8T0JFP6_PHAAN|nr:Outer envelope protein [Vigna angularis]